MFRSHYVILRAVVPVFFIACAAHGDEGDKARPAPPGELVDLGGRKLHMIRSGTGSPAVVIENGGGAFSVDWALVQPEVAKFTQVVAYDRAGYAWSDRGPAQEPIEQTVDDLHLLLLKARIRPPYVLVGASLGGIYARAFQRRKARHWAMGKLIDEVGLLPKGLPAAESWRQEFTALRRQRTDEAHPLGDLPLIAIERSQDPNEVWQSQQKQLAALSRVGKLVKAVDSGHMIQLDRPDVVVSAIRDVVTASRDKK